jgi:exocyst complex component 6
MPCYWRSSSVADLTRYAFSPLDNPRVLMLYQNEIVSRDDHVPMRVEKINERDAVLEVVWLDNTEQKEIMTYVIEMASAHSWLSDIPGTLCLSACRGLKPFIFAVRMCVRLQRVVCIIYFDNLMLQIRSFIQKFYQFVEGVSQHHRNIDELLSKVSRRPLK